MTFAVLAGIGTAIASGVGAVSGAIGGAVTAGLGAAGMATGAGSTAAAIGSTVGTAATMGGIGAGTGATMSAITGGDPGQGALIGGLTGGVTGGMGAALGGSGGAAGGITGQAGQAATAAQPSVGAITQGVASPGFQQAATGIQGAAEVAAVEPSVSAITQRAASPAFQQASQAAAANAAGSSGLGSFLNNGLVKEVGSELAKEGVTSSIEGLQRASASDAANKDMDLATASSTQEREDIKDRAGGMYAPNTLGGGKGLGWASGGQIALKEGQFIIPADVVSALGNGSTKAGARFLDDFFAAG